MQEQQVMPTESVRLDCIKSDQVRLVYAAVPASLLTILINSLLLAIVEWRVAEQSNIIIWFLIINCLSIVRLTLYHAFVKHLDQQLLNPFWYNLSILISVVSGLLWGGVVYFLFPEQNPVHQVFLGFVIAGMCAGGITTLSALLPSAICFVTSALLPVIIKFMIIDSEISFAMAIMSLLFLIMLIASAKRLNNTILQSLVAQYRYEDAEKTILHIAHYDELTQLPNRRLFMTNLYQQFAKSVRHNRIGALLFIDIDHFKGINDSLGHLVGDELLAEVAKRINSRLRSEDTAARLGGDEFVVLLSEIGSEPALASSLAEKIAEEIRNQFEPLFVIREMEIHLTASIGIALFPYGELTAENIIHNADAAMYQAKENGRNKVRLFTTGLRDAIVQHREIENELRNALKNDEFLLYFQAQFDGQKEIIGFEALLRWRHPEKGIILPGYFIEIAEKSHLIEPIGEWVLRTSFTCAAKLMHRPELVISVNVSPLQFSNHLFVSLVKRVISETGVNPAQLKFEITEGMLIDKIDKTIGTINQLKALGIRFSIDDFGTGYSSLAYLDNLPIDELKIDQSFVRKIMASPGNAVIVDTIIIMARNLNLVVIAEGVEEEAELSYLESRQCHYYQGYYFAKPDTFENILELCSPYSKSNCMVGTTKA